MFSSSSMTRIRAFLSGRIGGTSGADFSTHFPAPQTLWYTGTGPLEGPALMRASLRVSRPAWAWFALLWGLAAAPLFAAGPGKSFVLENGLPVFLYEKHDLPLVHLVTGFNVGSKDETEATSGLVHMLEHLLLFRGTSTRT